MLWHQVSHCHVCSKLRTQACIESKPKIATTQGCMNELSVGGAGGAPSVAHSFISLEAISHEYTISETVNNKLLLGCGAINASVQ